jgi:hypothetical protein
MSVWATQRKLTYISIVIFLLLILVAWPSYHFFYKPPTCSDGKQDGGEQGVDCGGPCRLLCPALALAPIVHWERVFQVSPGVYNAVAYVENPNLGSYAENVPYTFDVYNTQGTLIAERTGTTNIWANNKFAIFEAGINTGQSLAASVTFQFTATPTWIKDNLVFPQISIPQSSIVLSRTDTEPHLNATAVNSGYTPVSNLPFIAILYDANGNALAVSRTIVTYLANGASQNIYFVWSMPFSAPVAQTEIIPLETPIGTQATHNP